MELTAALLSREACPWALPVPVRLPEATLFGEEFAWPVAEAELVRFLPRISSQSRLRDAVCLLFIVLLDCEPSVPDVLVSSVALVPDVVLVELEGEVVVDGDDVLDGEEVLDGDDVLDEEPLVCANAAAAVQANAAARIFRVKFIATLLVALVRLL